MGKSDKHIGIEEFKRYLSNKMTARERNEFERYLQKNPFEAEALEGLSDISPDDFSFDLEVLHKRIYPKRSRKLLPYWVAAASFLIIVTTGIIFYLNIQSPIKQVAEVKVEEKAEEKAEIKKEVEIEVDNEEDSIKIKEELPKSAPVFLSPKVEKSFEMKESLPAPSAMTKDLCFEIADSEIEDDVINQDLKDDSNMIRLISNTPMDKSGTIVQHSVRIRGYTTIPSKKLNGTIISADDNKPLPGVTVVIKGSQNGTMTDMDGKFNFNFPIDTNTILTASFVGMENKEFRLSNDSENIIKLEPAQIALEEVIAVGYGRKKSSDVTGSISKTEEVLDKKAQPNGGFEEYKKYLLEKCILPEGIDVDKKVVKVTLLVDSTGTILKITPTNNPDSTLFELTKTIILDRPEWQPEVRGGQPVNSEIDFKVKFIKPKS